MGWPWGSYSTSVSPPFFICKIEIIEWTSQDCETKNSLKPVKYFKHCLYHSNCSFSIQAAAGLSTCRCRQCCRACGTECGVYLSLQKATWCSGKNLNLESEIWVLVTTLPLKFLCELGQVTRSLWPYFFSCSMWIMTFYLVLLVTKWDHASESLTNECTEGVSVA